MESSKYMCIFEDGKSCPAKTAYKLSPESLAQFCKVCVEKTKWDTMLKAFELVSTVMMNQKKSEENESKATLETEFQKLKETFPETTGEMMKKISESIKSMKRDPRDMLREAEMYEAFIRERKKQLQAQIRELGPISGDVWLSEEDRKKHEEYVKKQKTQ